MAGVLRRASGGHAQGELSAGVAGGGPLLGGGQAADHRRRDLGQLKDLFGLERHRVKTLGGLLARLAAKVAAYTCEQRLNALLGRPLRHLADLLV